mgnify:CR=1 FL=1
MRYINLLNKVYNITDCAIDNGMYWREKMKVCKMGLESIWIDHAQGDVRLCAWTGYNLGNLQEHSIEELWHGKKAEIFRQSMLDGSYRFCKCQACPYLAHDNLETMLVDYSVPEYPKFCSLSYEQQCNYVCKFCRKEQYQIKSDEKECIDKIEKEVQKFIGQLDTVSTNGVGELFCSTRTLNLLSTIHTDRKLEVVLESNGSLFNRKNWEKISNLGNYNLSVHITVHSFDEDTYRFLSGTSMSVNTVIDNLHFIQELRNQNIINFFEIATVICERNFREMPKYVEKCLKEFNPDRIRLRFFFPYGVNDISTEWFYDIRNPYHPYYKEFVEVMSNPIFDNPKVWKWQGDSLSKFGEHPYALENKKLNLIGRMLDIDNWELRMKSWKQNYSIKSVSLYGLSNACKCLITILSNTDVTIDKIYDSNINTEKSYRGYDISVPTVHEISSDAIIIMSVYHGEIQEKLQNLGYKGSIFTIEDMLDKLEKFECQER